MSEGKRPPVPSSRAVLSTIASISIAGVALAGCSFFDPEPSGLGSDEDLVVETSEVPQYQPEDTDDELVTGDLTNPVEDEGYGVTWWNQGVHQDNITGSVLTIKVRNNNDLPLPADAISDPVLEVADGNGGWTGIDLLPYDPEVNTNLMAPGLDRPLGAGATTNLQYRFDVAPGNLWNARLSIGNVVWEGDMNL
ncbi:MAG: hypothetical protein ACTIA3_04915 [Corynebacterium casei]|uniref:Uncharacterized protein n=1 Tax=Corynebacterium casei UCMA 3821 TaxID=1110505 RepID=G7HUD7_9CORY|nr:hypothetical protein [Corynebacterium casei]CCE53802.1 putative uncharacterized protein [Corynebacterium casei UCMA 3821]